VADQVTDTVSELFLVDLANPGTSVRLNPAVTAANVPITPVFYNDSLMAITTDYDTPGVPELYVLNYANPGMATHANAPLVAGANGVVTGNLVGGSKWAYVADQDTVGVDELYLTDLANPGVSTKLNPPLVAGGDVHALTLGAGRVTPDETKMVYLADQSVVGQNEIYVVAFATPGVATKVNGALQAMGNVSDFRITPDGLRVVYRADQDADGVEELYVVSLATPGMSTKLSGPLVAGGSVADWRLAPDGTRVYYTADGLTNGQNDLFAVALGTPGTAVRLNPAFADATRQVRSFTVAQDSTTVYYVADQDTAGVLEMYRANVGAPGASTKMSGTLGAGGTLQTTQPILNLAGTHVIYRADPNGGGVTNAYVVPVASPGTAVQANDSFVAGSTGVGQAFWTEDGSGILYDAEQATLGTREIWFVPSDDLGPGHSVRVNPMFGPMAQVTGGHAPIPVEWLFRQVGF
jgi:hypothetical protein